MKRKIILFLILVITVCIAVISVSCKNIPNTFTENGVLPVKPRVPQRESASASAASAGKNKPKKSLCRNTALRNTI